MTLCLHVLFAQDGCSLGEGTQVLWRRTKARQRALSSNLQMCDPVSRQPCESADGPMQAHPNSSQR